MSLLDFSPRIPLGTFSILLRSVKQESKLNVLEKISLARRTLYALLNVGVHGNTGLNPKISYKIYQCYVLPRLMSGIEAIPLNKSELNELEHFHRKTLLKINTIFAPQYSFLSSVVTTRCAPN